MDGKLAGGFVIFAVLGLCAEVRIGVLGLFKPVELVVTNSAGQRRIVTLRTEPFSESGSFRIETGSFRRIYDGMLQVLPGRDRLQAIISVDLEDAVAAVVGSEMPAGSPPPALAAMAIAARSFYSASHMRHESFHFCDTTHCQFYRGPEAMRPEAVEAARRTRGLVLWNGNRPFAAMYSASCGGKTRSAEDVGLSADEFPYPRVTCDLCAGQAERWTRRLPGSVERPVSNEGARLSINRKYGSTFLPSNNYTVRREGSEWVINGAGSGHGVGLCQQGAVGMAKKGAGYREILMHYLPSLRVREL